jgi:hypothetical protein
MLSGMVAICIGSVSISPAGFSVFVTWFSLKTLSIVKKWRYFQAIFIL